MLTEEQKQVHKEFRNYLRKEENQKGNMLNNIINATDTKLPALIKLHFRKDFDCIYDDKYTIEEMLIISSKIKSNENMIVDPYGYISSAAIDAYIRFYAKKSGINLDELKKVEEQAIEENENENEKRRLEGRVTEAKILRRQRNQAARQKCLEASNYTCYVCGFNFEKTYGKVGHNFLEVHHKHPLATYDDEHHIPQEELCALCSNCHTMLHRKKEVMDVDELKRLFEANKSAI